MSCWFLSLSFSLWGLPQLQQDFFLNYSQSMSIETTGFPKAIYSSLYLMTNKSKPLWFYRIISSGIAVVLTMKCKWELLIPVGPDQPVCHRPWWRLMFQICRLQSGVGWRQSSISLCSPESTLKCIFPSSSLYKNTWGRMCTKRRKRGFSVWKTPEEMCFFKPLIHTHQVVSGAW